MSLASQYAVQDKWEQELKTQDDLIHTRVWKGKSNFSLENFIQQHRSAFVSMQSCAEYVQYQLPTEHTQVGYLLAVIQCNYAGLKSAMASVHIDTNPSGKRKSFEATATHLLPYEHVAKKISSSKRGSSEISYTSKFEVSSFGTKAGIGKVWVHIWYHKPPEYDNLSKDQEEEFRKWRLHIPKRKGCTKGRDNNRPNRFKSIAAAVDKQVE